MLLSYFVDLNRLLTIFNFSWTHHQGPFKMRQENAIKLPDRDICYVPSYARGQVVFMYT